LTPGGRRILAVMRPAAHPAPPLVDVEAPEVSVVVVNYNVREFLEQALCSVERASEGLRVETFVVDNNSVDGSVERVRERFPEVHVIANEANVGFARANNQAIRRARGRYLLILNPDTLLQEDTLRALVAFMDAHPEAGAAGCRILNPDGTFAPESRRAFPTPSVALYRMLGLSRLFPGSRTFGRYNLSYLPRTGRARWTPSRARA
jgi:O-antigen biosynthesis protein